jgi:predicted ATP-binding protein involved in virulence
MTIDSIHITNFKGFADETFHLNPHFTVFIGNNATGKTSVLDALSVALGAFFIEIPGMDSRPIRRSEIRLLWQDGQPKEQRPVSVGAEGRLDGVSLKWKRDIVKKKTSSQYAKAIRQMVEQKLSAYREASGVVFPVIAYHGTGRLWATHEKIDFQKQGQGLEMGYMNCLSAKSSSKEFLEWYKTLEYNIEKFKDPLEMSHLAAFKRAVLDLVPDSRWTDMAFDYRREELMGMFVAPNGTPNRVAYSQLSDGFRNMIGIAADIAYRCIQLNPHLGERAVVDTPGVILIDELDMHLHPNWQKHIAADFKRVFPRLQFVATTHSPFIVQSLASDELVNLDRTVDASPNEMALNQVAEFYMGVESEFATENSLLKQKSRQVLQQLDAGGDEATIQAEINAIANPAVRAFLELAKMAKVKQDAPH